ncbi:hypothetical protein [Rudaea cellulosilytica]|uniref:hypothetical protein n=1 Tax=Rudaea cellulosilytica TaxID=540746 RepID=UPI0012FABD4B|nr:hypothetical protein [Rudaea cellulosilytica]
MSKFKPNQLVYVPSSLLPDGDREIFAMVRKRVNSVSARSIKVDLPGGIVSGSIGSSKAHAKIGIAIISIGDFDTEISLISPLSKSILQFSRLLLPDDHIASVTIRSLAELSGWWNRYQKGYTHIILIGHGDSTALYFGVGGATTPTQIGASLSPIGADKKIFISLCCEHGMPPFASDFSNLPFCDSLIAPESSIHGAAASQFVQTILNLHLLQGKSKKVAYNNANDLLPGKESFSMWQNGKKI